MRMQQKLNPADIKKIRLLDGFWKERMDVFEKITIGDILDKFESHRDYGGAFNNFKMVRDHKRGAHAGFPWYDGLIGETIRGISDFLVRSPDKAIEEKLDGYIKLMAEAQDASGDGWLNTYTTLICSEHRLGRDGGNLLWQHDLYNSGCIVEAAVHYYRATGKVNLLNIACKLANYMVSQIGPEPKDNIVPAHALPEEAYLKLYELFMEDPELKQKINVTVNETGYLDLVRFWLDMRGRHENRKSYPRYMGEYSQDHIPLAEQNEAVGHAVRAGLLYTGMAEYANLTGDEKYAAVSHRIWENITERKMHISGGIGAVHNEEKFGYEYQLPNTAYLETCAAASMVFFARSMFLRDGGGEYMEILERALYNGVLPGVSLKGDEYFYRNPLASDGNEKRWEWHGCPCCPPMFLKVLGEFPSYLYSTDEEGIYVNIFASSEVELNIPKHGMVSLVQETNFPWDRDIKITLQANSAGTFTLRIRLPEYAFGYSLLINGKSLSLGEMEKNTGYLVINREWKSGDEIKLSLDIKPFAVAAPYVKDNKGKAALQYGPLLYCVEETDNAMKELVIPKNYRLEMVPFKELPGILAICFEDTLYRTVYAVPYYAWANRKIGKMEVWLPVEDFKTSSAADWGKKLYRPYEGLR